MCRQTCNECPLACFVKVIPLLRQSSSLCTGSGLNGLQLVDLRSHSRNTTDLPSRWVGPYLVMKAGAVSADRLSTFLGKTQETMHIGCPTIPASAIDFRRNPSGNMPHGVKARAPSGQEPPK